MGVARASFSYLLYFVTFESRGFTSALVKKKHLENVPDQVQHQGRFPLQPCPSEM